MTVNTMVCTKCFYLDLFMDEEPCKLCGACEGYKYFSPVNVFDGRHIVAKKIFFNEFEWQAGIINVMTQKFEKYLIIKKISDIAQPKSYYTLKEFLLFNKVHPKMVSYLLESFGFEKMYVKKWKGDSDKNDG